MITNRRNFLRTASLVVAASMVVKAESLMNIVVPRRYIHKGPMPLATIASWVIMGDDAPIEAETYKDFLQKHLHLNEDFLKKLDLKWVQEGDEFAIYREHKQASTPFRVKHASGLVLK